MTEARICLQPLPCLYSDGINLQRLGVVCGSKVAAALVEVGDFVA